MTAQGDAADPGTGPGPDAVGAMAHVPVMPAEVLDALGPRDGRTYVDATYGDGGITRALLAAARCTVWALDRDPYAAARARALAEQSEGRLAVIEGRFGDLDALLAAQGVEAVDGVTFDLGVSSLQLNDATRGFSFRADGPLDMRMTPDGPNAADVVNSLPEGELACLLRDLGGERYARRVARAVAEARARVPIERTGDLAALVARVVPRERRTKAGAVAIHPATRTFQALRIVVNDELGELRRGLEAAEAVLAARGRLAVISFHSLEDREVKRFLDARSGRSPRGSRHAPPAQGEATAPTFVLPERGARRPSATEVWANPRARSAKLRWAERTAAPARGREAA